MMRSPLSRDQPIWTFAVSHTFSASSQLCISTSVGK